MKSRNQSKWYSALFLLVAVLAAWTSLSAFAPQTVAPVVMGVKIWEEETVIPTYLIGDPEPNPIFYFGQASQGAQGRLYPYPHYANLTSRKQDKKYKIGYLENEFIRMCVLPQGGARLFEGTDK